MARNDQAPDSLEQERSATNITREQVQDMYMAGTSDGVIFLEGGHVRQLDGAEQGRPHTRRNGFETNNRDG